MITLAIAEDHQSLIDGIKIFLANEKDIEIVGEANDGARLLEIVQLKKPDVVLTDIRMPRIDGITVTRLIKKEMPGCKIIAFSMFDQIDAITQMESAGASGYILKNSSLKIVLEAIKAVAEGDTFFDPSLKKNTGKIIQNDTQLSRREEEILKLISKGYTSQEIANMLFIGKTTVDTHRKNILRKLNLQGKTELLRYSLNNNFEF